MYTKILILLLCSHLPEYINCASSFDQRQTGQLNVQVDLKDLQIIALLKGGKEEYVDYDYAYDYSEMTIKPQNGTTPKPLSITSIVPVTEKDNNTVAAATVTAQTILPVTIKSNNSEIDVYTGSQAINDSTTTTKSLDPVVTETSEILSNKNTTITDPSSNNTNCKKGFVMNSKGDCELKLPSTGNALLKLVKLSQKLKLRRENRRNPTTVLENE